MAILDHVHWSTSGCRIKTCPGLDPGSGMTGFAPNYREDMAVKVNFLETRIFVLIYKIKIIQFILLILSKKK